VLKDRFIERHYRTQALVAIVVAIAIMVFHQVMGSDLVSTAKAFAIRFPLLARKMRVTELIAIVHGEPAVIVEVFAGTFDSIAETLVLGLREIGRRHIPTATILDGSRLPRGRSRCCQFGGPQARGTQEKNKCRYCQSIQSHDGELLFSRLPKLICGRDKEERAGDGSRIDRLGAQMRLAGCVSPAGEGLRG
jgi:hypothetical protein